MSRDLPLDPVLVAQQPQPAVMAIEPQAIEFLFMCLVADRSFMSEAKQLLQPHYFTAEEAPLLLVWNALIRADTEFGGCPFEVVYMLAREQLLSGQWGLSPMKIDTIFRADPSGLIWAVTHPNLDPASIRFGRDLMRKFLYERTVARPLQQATRAHANGQIPALDNILSVLTRQNDRLRSFQELPCVTAAPERGSAFEPASVFRATGVDYVDRLLSGQRVGDCNGLVGVTGGGKTTMAVHMGVAGAQLAWSESLATRSTPEFSLFFTYEEEGKKLRPRVQSVAFQIPRRKLESMRNWSELTTPGNLAEYERRLFQSGNDVPPSESERYDAGSVWLDRCFQLMDMSGSADFPFAGKGHVPEMASICDRVVSQRGQRLRSVYIDYAGLVCDNYISATSGDKKLMRNFLKSFPNEIRRQITGPYGCTVWVLHQLKGEAGRWSPLKLMHHSDAGESKDFAENMAVCGCMGTEDKTTGCRRFNFSKVRYQPGVETPPVTLKINEFGRMVDVTSQYIVDDVSQRFILRSEASQIQGLDSAARQPAAQLGARRERPSVPGGHGPSSAAVRDAAES